ncbi:putative MHC class I antigen protein [Naja naja]|nr:putative MHC class I antigen protein [Naja naja]
MALRSAPFLLLVLVTVDLRESCFGASSHSLKYFSTGISEPIQGQPLFVTAGYLDGQIFSHYDSNSRKLQPEVSWMEKVGKEDPQYWERETQISRDHEGVFRMGLEALRNRYNQSEGLHTMQRMYGCELRRDGSKGGVLQYGYEGRPFITFDKETLTWVAAEPQAQITQRKWDALPRDNQKDKSYLEEECIEWLEKYLSYGNETLQSTALEGLRVNSGVPFLQSPRGDGGERQDRGEGWDGDARLPPGWLLPQGDRCLLDEGREVWVEETFRRSVAPNADGTYHYWLSIRIDPKERGRYRCHVEHDGLQEPLALALEEPTNSKPNLGLIIIGCVVAAVVLRQQDGYKATPSE